MGDEEVKKFGRVIKPWDEDKWVENRKTIMKSALELKLACYPDLKEFLVDTDDVSVGFGARGWRWRKRAASP